MNKLCIRVADMKIHRQCASVAFALMDDFIDQTAITIRVRFKLCAPPYRHTKLRTARIRHTDSLNFQNLLNY